MFDTDAGEKMQNLVIANGLILEIVEHHGRAWVAVASHPPCCDIMSAKMCIMLADVIALISASNTFRASLSAGQTARCIAHDQWRRQERAVGGLEISSLRTNSERT